MQNELKNQEKELADDISSLNKKVGPRITSVFSSINLC